MNPGSCIMDPDENRCEKDSLDNDRVSNFFSRRGTTEDL